MDLSMRSSFRVQNCRLFGNDVVAAAHHVVHEKASGEIGVQEVAMGNCIAVVMRDSEMLLLWRLRRR